MKSVENLANNILK